MRSRSRLAHVRLIRHGESAANAGMATDDPFSIPLTDLGHAQAVEIASSFDKAPDLIVCSPFVRAIETAGPTIERFHRTPAEIWDIGEFTYLDPHRCRGTTVEHRRAWVAEYWQRCDPYFYDDNRDCFPLDMGKPGCESFYDFLARAQRFIQKLEARRGMRIAVFGHGQFFTAARLEMATDRSVEAPWSEQKYVVPELMRNFPRLDREMHMKNGEIYSCCFDGRAWFED